MLLLAPSPPPQPSAADWLAAWSTFAGAIAAGLTFVVALVAAGYAYGQWKVARQAREDAQKAHAEVQAAEVERSQPYVAVFLQVRSRAGQDIELVVQNFGPTAARNVKVTFDGPLERAGAQDDWTRFSVPELPYLAPGQQWTTWFDSGFSRYGSDLPSQYRGTVAYEGLDSVVRLEDVLLDFGQFEQRVYTAEPTLGDIAQAVQAVAKKMK